MCGIIGILSSKNTQQIELANALIKHRGPDDSGVFYDGHLALGHQRLSILDVTSAGHQPMISEDGRYVLIFNGEIYNHAEIRKRLPTGQQFRSHSDTETLLYALAVFGTDILPALNGIYAFAFYDREKKELLLARDPFGVKPLYYYWDGQLFCFGSEMKSFLHLEGFQPTQQVNAFINYLHFLWSPGEITPFRLVKKLLPGHFLQIPLFDLPTTLCPQKYYEIPFNGNYSKQSEKVLIDQLDQLLQASVKRQLLSDVPVGFFLSGGLDSSLLVAIAKKLQPEKAIQAFTINTEGIEEAEGFANDLHYARLVARHLKVDLEIVEAMPDIVRDFDKMIWHLDEPQADPAPLNVLNICRTAKLMGYKVLIGGTGGDDLFSGYRRHQALRMEWVFNLLPGFMAGFINSILSKLNTQRPFVRRIRKIMAGTGLSSIDRMIGYFSWMDLENILPLFNKEIREDAKHFQPDDYLKELLGNIPSEKDPLNQLLYLEMRSFLVDHNLNYTDKLSMAEGVEVRVPYLDLELVDFCTKIPPNLKLKGTNTKYLLKKVAERYLPKEVINRPKAGFGAPIRKWVKEDLKEFIATRLHPAQLEKQGIFDGAAVQQLIVDNQTGKIDAAYTIWCLLAIQSWMKQFVVHNK